MKFYPREQDNRPTTDERLQAASGSKSLGELMAVMLVSIAPPKPNRVVLTKAERRALTRAGEILGQISDGMNELDEQQAYEPTQTYIDVTLAAGLIDEILDDSLKSGYVEA